MKFQSFQNFYLDLEKQVYKNFSNNRYLESAIQNNSNNLERLVTYFYLFLKMSFSLIAIISLIKLGYSSKLRLTRLREIQDSFLYEKSRFKVLSSRFDNLFSSEGEQRFIKDQDQMISRNIIRVIWR